jgi:hypothetical protein
MNRYALRDDQWERIKDLLPDKPDHVGITADDNRRCVEAVSTAAAPEFLGAMCRNGLATGRTRPSGTAAELIKGGLAQRRRSRRRWWLGNPGRVSETLRGKRS